MGDSGDLGGKMGDSGGLGGKMGDSGDLVDDVEKTV